MKHDTDKVAQTIAQEIEKYPANIPADHGTFHHTLKMTKRESEAWLMAAWFLSKVEKISEDDKETFTQYCEILSNKAIAIIGK